ncbi:MAG TPA: hypothetical protein VD978_22160 [Azospirillum sp.]|nr:hypothetical protein [Azospirillum sp.]
MADNQAAADKLDGPNRRDAGVIQYFITAGGGCTLPGTSTVLTPGQGHVHL